MLCRGLPPCVNEPSPHHSFSPVAFGQLYSDGVQFPNAMLTWAETDGMDPARLYAASEWAKDVLSNIRTSEEGPRWKLQRSGSTWQKVRLLVAVRIVAGG